MTAVFHGTMWPKWLQRLQRLQRLQWLQWLQWLQCLQWLQWLQWLHPPRGNREKKTRTDHRERNAKEAARPVTQVFLGTSIKMGFPAPRIPERPQYTRQVKGDHRPRYTCIVDSFINTNHHEKSYGYR